MALSFSEIREGDALPPRTHACSRMDIVKYAAASGDFYPLHLDPDAPESRERGKLIVPGRYKQVCLGRLVVEWAGRAGFLRRLVCRYVDEDAVGEPLVCRGEVRRRFVENGAKILRIRVWTENRRGQCTTLGTAVLEWTDPSGCA